MYLLHSKHNSIATFDSNSRPWNMDKQRQEVRNVSVYMTGWCGTTGICTVLTRYSRQLFVHILLEISSHLVKMCHRSNHTVKYGTNTSKTRGGLDVTLSFLIIKCAFSYPRSCATHLRLSINAKEQGLPTITLERRDVLVGDRKLRRARFILRK